MPHIFLPNMRKDIQMPTLHENIMAISKGKKITLRTIERTCGLQAGAISKWKYVSPIAKNLKAVADYLGVSMDELYGEQEEGEQ